MFFGNMKHGIIGNMIKGDTDLSIEQIQRIILPAHKVYQSTKNLAKKSLFPPKEAE